MEDKYYIGIDPGKQGGITVLKNGKFAFSCVMPLCGTEVNFRGVAKVLDKYKKLGDVHVIFEKFGGFFGYAKKAAVSLGSQVGGLQATCQLIGVPFTQFMPTQWQKEMFTGQTVVMKKGKNAKGKDTKLMAAMVAKRLFPEQTFLATERSKKPHDGMVDAAMLAEFGKRKGL